MSDLDEYQLQLLREDLLRLGVPPVDARGEERPTYQMWLDLAAEVHWLRQRVQEAAQDVLAVSRAMGRIREVLITEGGMEDDDRSTVDMVREALALRADAGLESAIRERLAAEGVALTWLDAPGDVRELSALEMLDAALAHWRALRRDVGQDAP